MKKNANMMELTDDEVQAVYAHRREKEKDLIYSIVDNLHSALRAKNNRKETTFDVYHSSSLRKVKDKYRLRVNMHQTKYLSQISYLSEVDEYDEDALLDWAESIKKGFESHGSDGWEMEHDSETEYSFRKKGYVKIPIIRLVKWLS